MTFARKSCVIKCVIDDGNVLQLVHVQDVDGPVEVEENVGAEDSLQGDGIEELQDSEVADQL